VRCTSCRHRWLALPDANESATAEAPNKRDESFETARVGIKLDRAESIKSRSMAMSLPIVLTFVVIMALAGLFFARKHVAGVLPSAEALYGALGLGVKDVSELELAHLASKEILENGQSVIVITGEIRNNAAERRPLQRVRVALLDDSGGELQHGLFDTDEDSLEPGGVATFEARIDNPPDEARNFSVTLPSPNQAAHP